MRNSVRYLRNNVVEIIEDLDPKQSLLDHLRLTKQATGTKEGCNEGDCGACTVVLGELEGGKVRFRAVNACILFAPMLDGRALFTVESLKRDGALHPVQQAMVDHHGSQCGFCTPGFVMSLYAHMREGAPTDTATLKDALAGNLCRCTGYGPILAAGQAMGDDPESAEALIAALTAIRPVDGLEVQHKGRRFLAPRTLADFSAAVQQNPDATILAGGTDVGLWVTKQHRTLPTVISINEVTELRSIDDLGESIRIGAAVRYADAAGILGDLHNEFGELLRRLGGLQVRNLGPVCGNIANGSPIGDMPPALIAAGATLVLRRGVESRTIPLEDYFQAYGKQDRRPGEFVEAVIVPKIAKDRVFRVYKLSKRFDQDISAVCAGISIGVRDGRIAEARVAFGGMAATPKRAGACEAALAGKPWTEPVVRAAAQALAQDFQPITDMRASADYRLQAAKNLLLKAFLESGAPFRVLETEAVGHG
ncbi:MAG: xanthine dehydrogenase small subunit [Phenylobacterium sp.]